jgi:hypothetical protein
VPISREFARYFSLAIRRKTERNRPRRITTAIGSKKSHGLEYQWFSPAKNRVKHTFTRTVAPKVTSNLHSLPARRLTCVGGAGACWVSTEASASSRPGRDIALHGTSSFLIELDTKGTSTRISNIVILSDSESEIVHFGSLRQNEDH